MKKKKLYWRLCVIAVVIIIVVTYSPLVLATGRTTPSFLHLPFTLWVTMVLALALVLLTYAGSRITSNDEEEEL